MTDLERGPEDLVDPKDRIHGEIEILEKEEDTQTSKQTEKQEPFPHRRFFRILVDHPTAEKIERTREKDQDDVFRIPGHVEERAHCKQENDHIFPETPEQPVDTKDDTEKEEIIEAVKKHGPLFLRTGNNPSWQGISCNPT